MSRILFLLSVATVAFAEGASGTAPAAPGGAPAGGPGDPNAVPPGAGAGNWIFIAFFVLIGFMLWSSFRQSKKEKKKLQDLIAGLKIGDKIETIGGLRGTVSRMGEGELDITTGTDGSITLAAGAVKQVVNDDDKSGDQK